jgi:hypothetical protein
MDKPCGCAKPQTPSGVDLQYVPRRWVAEAAVELAAADDVSDAALRDAAFVRAGVRLNF